MTHNTAGGGAPRRWRPWETIAAHQRGGGGSIHKCGDTGAHSMVASMAAAAIDGSVFSTPLLSG